VRTRISLFLGAIAASLLLFFGHAGFALDQRSPQQAVQINQDVENVYKKALLHYRERQYAVVEWELRSLLELYPKNHRITSVLYLIGRSQYQQKKWKEAQQTLERLVREYPQSALVDDARFLLAAVAFQREDYFQTARLLLQVLQKSDDARLRDQTQKLLYPLLLDYLDQREVHQLAGSFSGGHAQALFDLLQALQAYREQDKERAKELLQQWMDRYPGHVLGPVARRYARLAERKEPEVLKIGVILPLTGYFGDEARLLLAGIRYAVETDPEARRMGIELVVRDSQGEMIEVIRHTRELIQQERVLAIIGELESDKTAVIGTVAGDAGVPVLAPAAKEDGLTTVAPTLVQMLPDLETRGQFIAEYAMNELQLRTFAILAPADKYGKQMTDSFAQTVDRLNGQIVAETWYYEDPTDLRVQFRHIREVGLEKMVRDSILAENPGMMLSEVDSLVKVVIRQKLESLIPETETGRRPKFADSTAIPVTSIDALFFPVYTEDISYVAPQMALYNIQAQILGGSFWNNEEELDRNARYVSGAIFLGDLYVDETDPVFRRFRDQFRARMGVTPSKLSILGYDTMRFLLEGIRQGARTHRKLMEYLKNTERFRGLLQPYDFSRKPRVNAFLHIMKYQDNTIWKVR